MGVDTYRAWSQSDIQTYFAYLEDLNKDLTESGEFVANQGLAGPDQAKVVRAGENSIPVTDGVFPEAKEFLLGYWIVDVERPSQSAHVADRFTISRKARTCAGVHSSHRMTGMSVMPSLRAAFRRRCPSITSPSLRTRQGIDPPLFVRLSG